MPPNYKTSLKEHQAEATPGLYRSESSSPTTLFNCNKQGQSQPEEAHGGVHCRTYPVKDMISSLPNYPA